MVQGRLRRWNGTCLRDGNDFPRHIEAFKPGEAPRHGLGGDKDADALSRDVGNIKPPKEVKHRTGQVGCTRHRCHSRAGERWLGTVDAAPWRLPLQVFPPAIAPALLGPLISPLPRVVVPPPVFLRLRPLRAAPGLPASGLHRPGPRCPFLLRNGVPREP